MIDALSSYEKKCRLCGKTFLVAHLASYVYKIQRGQKSRYDIYCCYTCWTKAREKRGKTK